MIRAVEVRRLVPAALALVLATVLATVVAVPLAAAPPSEPGTGGEQPHDGVPTVERLQYRWRLGGLFGTLARILIPGSGEGVMTMQPNGDGRLTAELLITSPKSERGEYWRYGSDIDRATGYVHEAWSSYRWRDEEKEKQERVEEGQVYDMVAAIYSIRRQLPRSTTTMRVWSDGKIYPVEVLLRGIERREVEGERIETVHYTVQGDRGAEGRYWKGTLELWLARDGKATPVEMHIERPGAALRLHLVDPSG